MSRHRPSVALLLCALAAACTRPGHFDAAALDPTSPAARAEAAADYRSACASCHGIDGRGAGPVAGSLRQPPTDLTLLAAGHGGTFPLEDTIAVIGGERAIDAHGTRDMPVWSLRLGSGEGATAVASIATRRRVEMLARYLVTLQRPAPTATPTPRPKARPSARKRTGGSAAPAAQKP